MDGAAVCIHMKLQNARVSCKQPNLKTIPNEIAQKYRRMKYRYWIGYDPSTNAPIALVKKDLLNGGEEQIIKINHMEVQN